MNIDEILTLVQAVSDSKLTSFKLTGLTTSAIEQNTNPSGIASADIVNS